VEAKAKAVSQEQVKAFYEANRARLQGQPLEAIAPQIELYLRRQAFGERQLAFERELRDKAGVQILLKPTRTQVPVPASAHSLGPADAPVTIVEFTDYQCPFCQRAQETVEEVLRRYEGKVRFVYRDLPLDMHSRAFAASRAARCAGEQGKFWEFHRDLLERPADLSDADLQRRASQLDLKADAFASCVASDRHDAAIRESLADASRLGVSATPTFFINGRMLSGARPFEQFREIIDEELAQGS
jgi:protein-disulfide isomerase